MFVAGSEEKSRGSKEFIDISEEDDEISPTERKQVNVNCCS